MAESIEHEFFGIRFVAVGDPVFAAVADTFWTCSLCGGRYEFGDMPAHAKYHKWQEFRYEKLEVRIRELEETIAEMVGADVISLPKAHNPR